MEITGEFCLRRFKKIAQEMSAWDRGILILSAMFMLFFGVVLFNDRAFHFLDGQETSPTIGYVLNTQSDVRQKSARGLSWHATSAHQEIRIGDSIFTGRDSEAHVKVQDNEVHIGENSLVIFKKHRGIDVSNLAFGSFKIKVSGNMKVLVNGEAISLAGHKTELKLNVTENKKPEFVALKGDTKIYREQSSEETKVSARAPASTPAHVTVFPPAPSRDMASPVYIWRTDDVYARKEERYRLRKERPVWVKPTYNLEWKDPQSSTYTVQLASDENFVNDLITETTPNRSLPVPRLKVGENFWRVSRGDDRWSRTQLIELKPQFAPKTHKVTSEAKGLLLSGSRIAYDLTWTAAPDAVGYFVEASPSPDFPSESTAIARTTQTLHTFEFTKAGRFHIRVRSVNVLEQLSEYDSTVVSVSERPRLAAPRVPAKDLVFRMAESPIVLQWKETPGAAGYEVEVVHLRSNKALTQRTGRSRLILHDLPNGPYTYQVVALDDLGRRGRTSEIKDFTVAAPTPVKLAKTPKQKEKERRLEEFEERENRTARTSSDETEDTNSPDRQPQRDPAAQSIRSRFGYREVPDALNVKYGDNRVQIEGAGFTMYSTGQLDDQNTAPLAALVTLHTQNWFNDFGIEAFIKSKIYNVNSDAKQMTPLSIEARVHERWRLGLIWKDILREIQVSLFLGAQLYRNESGGRAESPFSKQYNLIKGGTLISLPLGRRWDLGTELGYGFGFDGTRKYEFSGFLNYYQQKQWSYGAGYRIHLMAAGSDSTPTTLPFREGYVEFFSALRYLY